jgi:hypothetical protein
MGYTIFTIKFKHLEENNITYFSHMYYSLYYSKESLKATIYFFVHAFIPDIFEYNGSITIKNLNKHFC